MAWDKTPWAPPLVELAGGMAGHLLAWERHERDGSWWAWVSWVHEAGGRRDHKVVLVRANSLRLLEPPDAYKAVPRRVRGTATLLARPPAKDIAPSILRSCEQHVRPCRYVVVGRNMPVKGA